MADVTTQPIPPAAEPPEEILAAPIPPGQEPWWRAHIRLVAAGAAALVILAGLAAFVLLSGPKQVETPSVARLEYVSAMRAVRAAGLQPRIEPVRSDEPSGQIVAQSPRPGVTVDEDSTVVLRLSLGPGLVVVPDVRGQSRGAATRQLKEAGLGVTLASAASSTVPKGKVASTSPAASNQANRGSDVILSVSTGPQRVKTPDVAGLKEAEAERKLQAAGLRVVIVHEESSQPAGQVVAQKPKAGGRAKKGSTAQIVVATPPPTVTVPGVTGLDLSSAVSSLSGAGLRVVISERTVKSGKDGMVLEQSVAANARQPRGTTVTLTVARR